jgi:hypothetical protein
MREKIFALASVLTLLLTSGVAVAWGGPDGTIDTYFHGDGLGVQYSEALFLTSSMDGYDYLVQNAWTGMGDMTVSKSIDIEDHSLFCLEWSDANVDTQIWIDPSRFSSANVESEAGWDGLGGEFYREAFLGDNTVDVLDVSSIGDGHVVDDIMYKGDLMVYQSVGLNRAATCDFPEAPDAPEAPVCGWC